MKKLIFSLIWIVLFLISCETSQVIEDFESQNIDVLHYQFNFTLSDESNEVFAYTEVNIQFLEKNMFGFYLDFVSENMLVDSIIQNGKPLKFLHENDRLHIHLLKPSKEDFVRNYSIYYHGAPKDGLIISKNKFDERTFFGDNWPNRAQQWLPVVDHPSDKATCEFIITAPSYYKVVSNGYLVEESNLSDTLKRTHWRENVPISTKVMVFGAARFVVQYFTSNSGISVQSWVFPQDKNVLFKNFALASSILNFFEEHFGEYPYEKLANVQSKTRYGGMENAGSIFYAEHRMYDKQKSEDLLAHEIAHQWFGNSVSECDWKHIWLSEGFATYSDHLYLEYASGSEAFIAKMKEDKEVVFSYHESNSSSTIVDENVTDLLQLLNRNTYDKASWVLHMLRHMIGEDVFWDLLQKYYQRFQNKIACTDDFINMVEKVTSTNYQWFFDQWLYRPELPEIKGNWSFDKKSKILKIDLKQLQGDDFCFKLPIEIAIYSVNDKNPITKKIMLDEKDESFRFGIDHEITNVILDPNTWVLMKTDFTKKN